MEQVLLRAERHFYCPNCGLTSMTTGPLPEVGSGQGEFHNCPALYGMTAPLVPAGTRCKVETHEREDYIGGEIVTVDGRGRPIMSVTTTRDTGEDCIVFAPCATARAEAR